MKSKQQKAIVPFNNYCEHAHSMSKGVNVYNSEIYKNLSRTLEGEFLPLENKAFFDYEKWITK